MSSPIGVAVGRPGNLLGTTGGQPVAQSTPTAEASPHAPAALALPAAPRRAADAGAAERVRSAAAEPAKAGVAPSRADVAKGKLVAAGDKLMEARQAGVDVAKSSFWKKALGTVVSAVAVGVAAGLTAISFGGAAPLLALACVNFAVSGGDAICAYRNMRNAEAVAELRPPPYEKLPMGNSIVANVIHGVLTRCGVSADTAATASTWGSRAVSLGLGVASVAVSAGLSGLPMAYDLAGKISSAIGTGAAVASTLTGAMTDEMDREILQDTVDEIRQDVSSLQSPEQGRSDLDAEGRTMAGNILRSIDGTDTPQALHDASLADAGRVKDAVVGGVGVLKVVAPMTGLMDLVHRV